MRTNDMFNCSYRLFKFSSKHAHFMSTKGEDCIKNREDCIKNLLVGGTWSVTIVWCSCDRSWHGLSALMVVSLLITHPNKSSSKRNIHRVCVSMQIINKNIENANKTIYRFTQQSRNDYNLKNTVSLLAITVLNKKYISLPFWIAIIIFTSNKCILF